MGPMFWELLLPLCCAQKRVRTRRHQAPQATAAGRPQRALQGMRVAVPVSTCCWGVESSHLRLS